MPPLGLRETKGLGKVEGGNRSMIDLLQSNRCIETVAAAARLWFWHEP